MAKRITELQELTTLDNSYNMLIDSGIQSFKMQAGNFKKNTVEFLSTTGTASYDFDIYVLSGASFTLTLPTAVGNTGKIFEIIHAGTSLSQVYTLNTTSAQTIGGVASGVYKLMTNQENLKIASNGTNWIVLSHYAQTARIAYTPTITGAGSVADMTASWMRQGKYLDIQAKWTNGTVSAALGTLSLPSPLNVDHTNLAQSHTAFLGNFYFGNTAATGTPSTARGPFVVTAKTTTTTVLDMQSNVDTDAIAAGGIFANENFNAVSSSSLIHTFNARVPITEFQP